MGKFYFYYGTMGAGKTSIAISKANEFKLKGKRVYVYLPNKVWKSKLESRNGSFMDVDMSLLGDDHLSLIEDNSIIIVDEAQFLNLEAVKSLKLLSAYHNCLVFCFGLLTDFNKELFEGTKYIIQVADSFREIASMCDNCSKKSQYNFRLTNESEIVVLEKNKYRALCNNCYDHFLKVSPDDSI